MALGPKEWAGIIILAIIVIIWLKNRKKGKDGKETDIHEEIKKAAGTAGESARTFLDKVKKPEEIKKIEEATKEVGTEIKKTGTDLKEEIKK